MKQQKNKYREKLSCVLYKNANKVKGDLLNTATFLNILFLRKMPLLYSCNKSTQEVQNTAATNKEHKDRTENSVEEEKFSSKTQYCSILEFENRLRHRF